MKTINEMAQKAGFPERRSFSDLSDLYPRLERFAELVRADEQKKWEGQTTIEINEAILESKEAMKLALDALEELDGIDTETECVTIDVGNVITALREALVEQPAQQEPVKYKCTVIDNEHPDGVPLERWGKPAQRTWVGLSDDELWALWNANTEPPFPEWFVDFKRSYEVIEAKIKEKNT